MARTPQKRITFGTIFSYRMMFSYVCFDFEKEWGKESAEGEGGGREVKGGARELCTTKLSLRYAIPRTESGLLTIHEQTQRHQAKTKVVLKISPTIPQYGCISRSCPMHPDMSGDECRIEVCVER